MKNLANEPCVDPCSACRDEFKACYLCRRAGVDCADFKRVGYEPYYQLVPGVGYVTGPGTARFGAMPHELTVRVSGGRKTKSGLDATDRRAKVLTA